MRLSTLLCFHPAECWAGPPGSARWVEPLSGQVGQQLGPCTQLLLHLVLLRADGEGVAHRCQVRLIGSSADRPQVMQPFGGAGEAKIQAAEFTVQQRGGAGRN